MASLPYVTSPGNIDKALNGIRSAAVPDKVSQDFVKTILKIPGGSGAQITAFLKKLGLAGVDGTPNDAYKTFRNPTSSGGAIANAIRYAYKPLYIRNEYMHKLNDEELLGLVVEETGQPHDSNPVKLIVACIKRLKEYANFEEYNVEKDEAEKVIPEASTQRPASQIPAQHINRSVGLNLGYTIHLNLPATSDSAVFDAIFKSLKENLLSDDDA